MRKVFIFWGIILLVLISGIVAVVYGKSLLAKEEKNGRQMRMNWPEIPALPKRPIIPEIPDELGS